MHFNDTLYLTERQVKLLHKGKEVPIWREGKRYLLVMKPKSKEATRIIKQIEKLKLRLKKEGKK